jgi:hypothetical protein
MKMLSSDGLIGIGSYPINTTKKVKKADQISLGNAVNPNYYFANNLSLIAHRLGEILYVI